MGERVEAPALAGPAQLSPLLCTLPRNRTISTNCIPDCTINTPPLLSQSYFSALLPDNFYKFTQKPSLAFFAHCAEPVQVEPPQLAPIVTKIVSPPRTLALFSQLENVSIDAVGSFFENIVVV